MLVCCSVTALHPPLPPPPVLNSVHPPGWEQVLLMKVKFLSQEHNEVTLV